MNLMGKINSLENELGKLMTEHLFCNVERRRLERRLEVKNDELEDLKRELGFSKDAEAKAIKRYKRALEYNIEVEAEVSELKTRFDEERRQLLGQLSHFKGKLRGETANWKSVCEGHVNDVKCSSTSRNRREFAKPTVLPEGKIVGKNGVACNHKRQSPTYAQISGSGDVSGDASNHSDDSSSDASDQQETEQTNIKIYVRFFNGKMITMSVKPTLTIDNLKSKIEEKEGIPTHQQLLVFEEKELRNNRTLAQCNIQKKSIIGLELRLKGGAKI